MDAVIWGGSFAFLMKSLIFTFVISECSEANLAQLVPTIGYEIKENKRWF